MAVGAHSSPGRWEEVPSFLFAQDGMKSSTTTLAVLGAALLALCALSAVDAANMDKYYKRTGKKFLAEKETEEGVHKLPSGLLYKVRICCADQSLVFLTSSRFID